MAGLDEDRVQSDRSLFSMVVDAAVSQPERHRQVFAHVPVKGDLLEALEVLKDEFSQVPWQTLEDGQQVKTLEQIQTRLGDTASPASKLAVRALHWGLQNRKHRRPQVARDQNSSIVNEHELDEFM